MGVRGGGAVVIIVMIAVGSIVGSRRLIVATEKGRGALRRRRGFDGFFTAEERHFVLDLCLR